MIAHEAYRAFGLQPSSNYVTACAMLRGALIGADSYERPTKQVGSMRDIWPPVETLFVLAMTGSSVGAWSMNTMTNSSTCMRRLLPARQPGRRGLAISAVLTL